MAGFIGSPSMNFATTSTEGEHLMLGNARLEMSGKHAQAAADRPKGTNLLIGFRPEHLEIADGQGPGAVRIPAKIEVVEYLGNEELIHAQSEGHEVVALVPSDHKVSVGDSLDFAIPVEKLHLFDPETEKSLAE